MISLAAQLNSRLPATVDLPPASSSPRKKEAASDVDPLMNIPDPRTIVPGERSKGPTG